MVKRCPPSEIHTHTAYTATPQVRRNPFVLLIIFPLNVVVSIRFTDQDALLLLLLLLPATPATRDTTHTSTKNNHNTNVHEPT